MDKFHRNADLRRRRRRRQLCQGCRRAGHVEGGGLALCRRTGVAAGVRLLQRTTRSLSLTPEGEVFHARCRNCWVASTRPRPRSPRSSGEASGLLRINVPLTFGLLHLAPLWAEFMAPAPEGHARRDAGRPRGGSGRGRLRHGRAHRRLPEFVTGQPAADSHAHGAVCLAGLSGGARLPTHPSELAQHAVLSLQPLLDRRPVGVHGAGGPVGRRR